MAFGCKHTIHSHNHHFGWDNSIAPAMTVAPGESVFFETVDSSGGQFSDTSTVADVVSLDFGNINPVTGPIAIDGAEPGDAVKVTFLDFEPCGWGWTALIPGFGLLTDQFPEPALNIWKYEADKPGTSAFGSHAKVPLKPFAGTIGLAPAEPGLHSVVPPRRVGGNMDIRDMSVGTELYLPVEVAGGLFSLGDTHAVQGDGEVCGTAIESQMNVALKFDLVKGAEITFPHYRTSGPVTNHLDSDGYFVTTGIGPDLFEGARNAVEGMINLLGKEQGLAAADAYMLCSVCGDLRISEIVDMPNWVVSFYFPRCVFE